jgi:hypothetical protein
MRERDRLLLTGGVVIAVLIVVWMFVVSPERKSASDAKAQVAAAQQSLASAQSQLATAQGNKQKYSAAYSALVAVGKAVPATSDVPSLIYEIDQASDTHDDAFGLIQSGSGSATSSPGSSSAAVSGTPTAFTPLPFQFQFTGTFFDLYHLLGKISSFAVQTKDGTLQVTGRLLTITGASLQPFGQGAGGPNQTLNGTVSAVAYVLPAGATAAVASPAGSTPAAPGGGTSTPTTPAVVQP